MADATTVRLDMQPQQSEWRRALRRMLSQPITVIGLILVVLAVVCALIAPKIAPFDPVFGNLREHLQPPSSVHLFGTDHLGRDIASRVVYGSQISLKIALATQALTLVIGLLLGLIGGYYGGWIDAL